MAPKPGRSTRQRGDASRRTGSPATPSKSACVRRQPCRSTDLGGPSPLDVPNTAPSRNACSTAPRLPTASPGPRPVIGHVASVGCGRGGVRPRSTCSGSLPSSSRRSRPTDRRVVVRAGAGAGKTRVLTQRVVRRVHRGVESTRATCSSRRSRARPPASCAPGCTAPASRASARARSTAPPSSCVREVRAPRGEPAPPVLATGPAPALHRGRRRARPHASRRRRSAGSRPSCPGRRRDGSTRRPTWPARARRDGASRRPRSRWRRSSTPTTGCCRRRGVLDFDGLLEEATQLLEHDDERARRVPVAHPAPVRRRAPGHEPRPVRPARARWRATTRTSSASGDPNQSIYGWNGADPHLLDVVVARWPPTRVLSLPRNHRSTEAIVRAATAALDRGPLDLVAATEGGAVPRIVAFRRRRRGGDGGRGVVPRRSTAPRGGGARPPSSRRTNAALDALAAACAARRRARAPARCGAVTRVGPRGGRAAPMGRPRGARRRRALDDPPRQGARVGPRRGDRPRRGPPAARRARRRPSSSTRSGGCSTSR